MQGTRYTLLKIGTMAGLCKNGNEPQGSLKVSEGRQIFRLHGLFSKFSKLFKSQKI